MGLSVSTSMGFENREYANNFAQKSEQGNCETAEQTINSNTQPSTIYSEAMPLTTQQYILLASTQITVNNSLKETLKYLREHADQKKKEYVFGDLWNIMSTQNESSEKNPYKGELLDIVIDQRKNIFAA